MHIWNVEDGREVADILAHTDGTSGVTFSPDPGGRWLATAGADRRARIWDSSTFAELLTLVGSSEGLRTLAFAPSGDRLATGGADWAVRVWSTVFEFNHGATIRDVAFSPNGVRLATAGEDGRGMIWDAASGSKIRELPHSVDSDFKLVHRIVFSPDGTRVVTAGANARAKIWDAVSGALLWTLCRDDLDEATRQLACHVNEIDDAEFSPDGGTLATASRDEIMRPWDVKSGEYLGRLGDLGGPGDHPSWVSSVAFSPDGTLIATGCWDGNVRLWDASTRQFRMILTSPFRHAVLRLAFSADGRLAAARFNGDVEVWDVTSTSRLSGWPAHGGRANDVAFPPAISPTGLVLATAGEDRTAKLWGAGADWDLRLVLTQQAGVDGVAFSPDGVRLAAGGASRQASIYVVDEQSLLALAASRAKRALTTEECQRYLRQPTCPSSP